MLIVARCVAADAASGPVVGISMPNTVETRWISDGASIAKDLQQLGYGADLRNAENDVAAQIDQIEGMIKDGDRALIIAPVDDSALVPVLAQAAAAGVRVIAYDRLIRKSPSVDGFATFDNFQVGVLQAQSLIRGLGLPSREGPFNIELFAGSPDDGNAHLFFDGAMSVLRPLVEGNILRIPSGEASFRDTATLRWNVDLAHARLDNLLSAYYTTRRLDAVLSPNDEISRGISVSLQSAGYGRVGMTMPIITGQDCEITAVKAIMQGKQYSSVFKDTRKLAAIAAEMAAALLTGRPVPVNDTSHYNNGVKQVPTFVMAPAVVYKENLDELLIRSGYYSVSQID